MWCTGGDQRHGNGTDRGTERRGRVYAVLWDQIAFQGEDGMTLYSG